MIELDIEKELYGSNGAMSLSLKTSIKKGCFVSLCGQSGSGKTTLLRILAGLEEAKGSIIVDGEVWLGEQTLPVQKRQLGFVFQDYALFENMSVLQNLLYANNDKRFALKLLEMIELKALANQKPKQLSGGQKQRVALARAMMNKPKLLLMDEPLSALDPTMRTKLQQEILMMHEEFKTTTLMVSHDPSEIYRLSERVLLLEQGQLINEGTPKEVLLKTQGSAKFSFEGELLDLTRSDVVHIAVVAIGQQLVEVVISSEEAHHLKIGQRVSLSTKAFSPNISSL